MVTGQPKRQNLCAISLIIFVLINHAERSDENKIRAYWQIGRDILEEEQSGEDQVKQDSDNSTIGLIMCTEKYSTIAKYSVLNEGKQIFASIYKLYLPDEVTLKAEIKKERELLEIEQKLGAED